MLVSSNLSEKVPVSVFEEEQSVIGLFFSGIWCPPSKYVDTLLLYKSLSSVAFIILWVLACLYRYNYAYIQVHFSIARYNVGNRVKE